jgi:hypothetical protein
MPKEELFKTQEYIISTSHITQVLASGVSLSLNADLYSFSDSKLKNFEISIHRFKDIHDQPEYLFKGFLSDLVNLIENYGRLKTQEES